MTAEFTTDRPIYLQILDYCMDCIASGHWQPGGRIPAVKELSVNMSVNPRTVMRTYEELSGRGIIFQRRGLGFYVTDDGRDKVMEARRTEFEHTVLPDFIARMRKADFPPGRVIDILRELQP